MHSFLGRGRQVAQLYSGCVWEAGTGSSGRSKGPAPSSGLGITHSSQSPNGTKGFRKGGFVCSSGAETSILPGPPWFHLLGLGLPDSGFAPAAPGAQAIRLRHITPCLPWVSSLWTADQGTSWPQVCESIPMTSLLLWTPLYTPLVLLLWRSLASTRVTPHVGEPGGEPAGYPWAVGWPPRVMCLHAQVSGLGGGVQQGCPWQGPLRALWRRPRAWLAPLRAALQLSLMETRGCHVGPTHVGWLCYFVV